MWTGPCLYLFIYLFIYLIVYLAGFSKKVAATNKHDAVIIPETIGKSRMFFLK